MATETKNETILIQWENVMFSENVFAFFEYGMVPVISNKLEDVCLPDNYLHEECEGHYEIFAYNEECEEYIYTGRLYIPKGQKLNQETALN